jgi:hypothetical protein
MAFNGNLEHLGPAGSYGVDQWTYNSSDDTTGACLASGYFNSVAAKLEKGALIWVSGNDDSTRLVRVTSNSYASPVTVAAFEGVYAPGDLLAGSLCAVVLNIDAGAAANYDYDVLEQYRLVDAMVTTSTQGTAGDTLQIKDNGGTNSLTDAMDLNVAEGAIVRASSLNQNHTNLLVGANNLRITTVQGGVPVVAAARVTLILMKT